MAIKRIFLGWDRPLCETVPEWMLQGHTTGTVDLRGTVVGMPTRQSSWRLRTALSLVAHDQHEAALLGPEIVTASVLIAAPPRPGCASELQSLLAWCQVLREAKAGDLDDFLGPQRPGTSAWALQIARRLSGLRRELADGALSIVEVAGLGTELVEAARWQAMAKLEQRYLACLAGWGLRDGIADQLEHARRGELSPDVTRVVLAAVPDPPRLLITLLEAWVTNGGSVDVLVAAPESEAAAFDAWGRPQPEAWERRDIVLDDRNILLAANPEDEAACIARLLKEGLKGGVDATKRRQRPSVAIGVPDRETVAPLQRELAGLGLPAFDPQNQPMSDTPLLRLAQALLAWHDHPGYAETATLLRHPHVLATLPQSIEVLRALDTVQAQHLPVTFADLCQAAQGMASGESRHSGLAKKLVVALKQLEAWRSALGGSSLATGLRAVIQAIYAGRKLHPDNATDMLFQQAGEVLDAGLAELSAAEAAGLVGPDAAAVLSARLQGATIKSERGNEVLDLEGWLELAWNPEPVLCVAGMNEGFVPDGHVGDLFLPDSLRRQLGLRDDRLRVARDAYVLTAVCAQRANRNAIPSPQVVLLVGKRTNSGDPLRPSRLLFRCPDEMLVQRAHVLFGNPPPVHTAAAHSIGFKLDPQRVSPGLMTKKLPDEIGPTTFRDYLACPFQFYLKRVLQMQAVDDRARELDAMAFGNLCHAVVEAMAQDEGKIWACGDAAQLSDWLDQRTESEVATLYGTTPWLGVTLALETAKRRLRAFAAKQVEWHAQGWDIIEHETELHVMKLNGSQIKGRIDRIDKHRDGRICVWDYKTSDQVKSPFENHTGSVGDDVEFTEAVLPVDLLVSLGLNKQPKAPKRWIDLQLPLYREMVRAHYGPDVHVGYILLPAARGDATFALWENYSDALHTHALACAGAVLDRIHQGVFWPANARARQNDLSDLLLDEASKTFVPPLNPWPLRNAVLPSGTPNTDTERVAP